jgi:hypothetical protein
MVRVRDQREREKPSAKLLGNSSVEDGFRVGTKGAKRTADHDEHGYLKARVAIRRERRKNHHTQGKLACQPYQRSPAM